MFSSTGPVKVHSICQRDKTMPGRKQSLQWTDKRHSWAISSETARIPLADLSVAPPFLLLGPQDFNRTPNPTDTHTHVTRRKQTQGKCFLLPSTAADTPLSLNFLSSSERMTERCFNCSLHTSVHFSQRHSNVRENHPAPRESVQESQVCLGVESSRACAKTTTIRF